MPGAKNRSVSLFSVSARRARRAAPAILPERAKYAFGLRLLRLAPQYACAGALLRSAQCGLWLRLLRLSPQYACAGALLRSAQCGLWLRLLRLSPQYACAGALLRSAQCGLWLRLLRLSPQYACAGALLRSAQCGLWLRLLRLSPQYACAGALLRSAQCGLWLRLFCPNGQNAPSHLKFPFNAQVRAKYRKSRSLRHRRPRKKKASDALRASSRRNKNSDLLPVFCILRKFGFASPGQSYRFASRRRNDATLNKIQM